MTRIAELLCRAARRGDKDDHAWFEQALSVAVSRNVGLDEVIIEAVREILESVEHGDSGKPW